MEPGRWMMVLKNGGGLHWRRQHRPRRMMMGRRWGKGDLLISRRRDVNRSRGGVEGFVVVMMVHRGAVVVVMGGGSGVMGGRCLSPGRSSRGGGSRSRRPVMMDGKKVRSVAVCRRRRWLLNVLNAAVMVVSGGMVQLAAA